MKLILNAILVTSCLTPGAELLAQTRLGIESGGVWQQRNDVQIPGDTGSRFGLDDITGSGPNAFVRLELSTTWHDRHNLRLVYAPLRLEEAGTLEQPVGFAGAAFTEGDVAATYQFDAHRITYRYRALEQPNAALYAGVTVLVRDAEIRLDQNDAWGRDTDVGLVPLVHLAGHYTMSSHWQFSFDLDGLAAPQGRAFDLGLQGDYLINDQWTWFTGVRMLDGGVDNDEVYNFARFHYATTGLRLEF